MAPPCQDRVKKVFHLLSGWMNQIASLMNGDGWQVWTGGRVSVTTDCRGGAVAIMAMWTCGNVDFVAM